MQTLAARRLTDRITFGTLTTSIDVDPGTGLPTETGDLATTPALCRQASAVRDVTDSVEYQARDLTVWVGLNVAVAAGDTVNIIACPGDRSLQGMSGTIVDVSRDSVRAIRRFGLKLENTT